jgi:glyoxylase-like metal-dependent hydrolase (beta-lactamase superfamily II)
MAIRVGPVLRGFAGVVATISCAGGAVRSPGEPVYEVAAVRFATIPAFRVRSLVAGADSSRRLDIAMMIWPLRGPDGDIVLVDAGFARQKFITQWKPTDYLPPDSALSAAGYDPARVSDIIITHIHWDHADGVTRFPKARIWMQREEFEYYVGADGSARQPAIDPEVAAMYRQLFLAGRVLLLEGDSAQVRAGIRVHTGGKHTFASQYVSARTPGGTVVLASDNAYLYENLEKRRPIAQTLDSVSNLAAQQRMLRIASAPGLVVPGHDPLVFTRFQLAREGVAVIR